MQGQPVSEHKTTYAPEEGNALACVSLRDILQTLAVPGLGKVGARRLLEEFGSVTGARKAATALLGGLGIKADAIRALHAGKAYFDADEEIAKASARGAAIIPVNDERYPLPLRHLHDAPLALYVKGELRRSDLLAVAVVGARRASVYGCMQAGRLAGDLARAGFTIVSGFARGIDSAAHDAALKAGGRTLAALGNGLAGIYPRENEALAEQVIKHGALISELPMDTAPTAANFPPRNRIIAALSLGVLVVEASQRSGALITARLAGELGKEVFAVPGDINRPQTRGVHRLIREGAKLVASIDDILEELGPLALPVQVSEDTAPAQDPRVFALNVRERKIYDLLNTTPKDIDQITREAGMAPGNVASTLTVLEIKRLVRRHPGRRYAKATPAGAEA